MADDASLGTESTAALRATRARAEFGLEVPQAMLGHASADITQCTQQRVYDQPSNREKFDPGKLVQDLGRGAFPVTPLI